MRGTFHLSSDSNLRSAARVIPRASQREEMARFLAFRPHRGYDAEFFNRARRNEKRGRKEQAGSSGGITWRRPLWRAIMRS